jgi:AcrR family transcriptional regulator
MDDMRRVILDHAVELVAEHGVRGVSFREVARRAGVSHQAPYHHFGNLHGIIEAMAREGFAALTLAMQRAARSHDDPVKALTAIGLAYVRFATKNVGYFRVMFQRSLVDVHDEAAPIEQAGETYQTLIECSRRVTEAGFGPQRDPDRLAHLAWSMVHGLSTLIVEGTLQTKTQREANAEARLVIDAFEELVRGSRCEPAAGAATSGYEEP